MYVLPLGGCQGKDQGAAEKPSGDQCRLQPLMSWTSLGVGWAIRDLECKDNIWVTAFDSNAVSVGMLETGESQTV